MASATIESDWKRWLADQGVEILALDCEPALFPPEQGGRGLAYSVDVKEGQILMRVPRAAMLTGERSRSLLPPELLPAMAARLGRDLGEDDFLALSLVVFCTSSLCGNLPSQKGDVASTEYWCPSPVEEPSRSARLLDPHGEWNPDGLSALTPWIRLQPRPEDLVGLPVLWPDADLEALRPAGTLLADTARVRGSWAAELAALSEAMGEGIEGGDWVWARCVVRTRAFLDGLDDGGLTDMIGGGEGADHMLGIVMVPLADMLNHTSGESAADTSWSDSRDVDDLEDQGGRDEDGFSGGSPARSKASLLKDPFQEMEDGSRDAVVAELFGEEAMALPASSFTASRGTSELSEGWYIVRASSRARKGAQCRISYGERALCDLLDTYGFAPAPKMSRPPEIAPGMLQLQPEDVLRSRDPREAFAGWVDFSNGLLGRAAQHDDLEVGLPSFEELDGRLAATCAEHKVDSVVLADASVRQAGLARLGCTVRLTADVVLPRDFIPGFLRFPHPQGGMPWDALAWLRVAAASCAEDVDAAVRGAETSGFETGSETPVSKATERQALVLVSNLLGGAAVFADMASAALALKASIDRCTSEFQSRGEISSTAMRQSFASRVVCSAQACRGAAVSLALCGLAVLAGETSPMTDSEWDQLSTDYGYQVKAYLEALSE
jgi:hypothetical protein